MNHIRIVLTISLVVTFFKVCSQPTVIVYVENSSFNDRFLNSLEADFVKNFNVIYVVTTINDIGNEANLIKSIIDGTILSSNGITKKDGVFYIFLTHKPLFFAENPSDELRGFSVYHQSIGIVSSHKIKAESSQLVLNYEFQFFKVVKHEFLHLLGLSHCINDNSCMMVASFPPSNFHNSLDLICPICFSSIDSSLVRSNLLMK